MITKILIDNRGDDGRMAVAAQPNRRARQARAGEFTAETSHV